LSALYEDRAMAASAVERLKVFAQPQRLMILSCLLRGERNVGDIAAMTGITQPTLSQQLAELRRADLVRTRKEAKQVWYALADENVGQCVSHMEALFGSGEAPAPGPTANVTTPRAARSDGAGAARFAQVLPALKG
jgi:DNA-binding transcriptional ArsR family regulator